ncbi:hypothetical protein CFP66_03820 [Pseudonocardia sp. MH-G8]|nr:hypothetical protein CFP66_03820 [Pseudonocardia sp. MH-G8]
MGGGVRVGPILTGDRCESCVVVVGGAVACGSLRSGHRDRCEKYRGVVVTVLVYGSNDQFGRVVASHRWGESRVGAG